MRRFSFILLAYVMASACTIKTLYNQLDWLLADYLESYVELSGEQQTSLYKHLDKALRWHKASQLPLYVIWLQDFKQDVQGKLTYSQAEQNFTQLHHFFRSLRAQAADELSGLLIGLSASQREELYRRMDKKNSDFADRFIHISRAEQLEQYTDRMHSRIDDWLDSITDEQEAIIRRSAEKIMPLASYVMQTRRRWQAEFKAILESRQDASTTQQAMHELFVNTERLRSEQYRAGMQHNQQVLTNLIVDVAASMTKEQRQYFNARVDNYSRYFTELVEEVRVKQLQP